MVFLGMATKLFSAKQGRKQPQLADVLLPEAGSKAPNTPTPTIFINYRRQENTPEATYLRAALARRFGAEKIFRDLDSLKPGVDYTEIIGSSISTASVFI